MQLPTCRRAVLAVAIVAGLHIGARDLAAASFSVNPVQVYLSPRVPSAVVSLRNDSDQTRRFQLSGFSWDQTAQDQIQLTPTTDIIFFPRLVTLAPKEERKIRVGAATPFAGAEKAYRLFVEELPPVEQPGESRSGVAVRTRMGIPVFLAAAKADSQLEIADVGMQHGTLSFRLRNSGNSHLVAGRILVRGFGSSGEVVAERTLNGWYVLGGRTHQYEIQIPPGDCSRILSSTVEVQTGKAVVKERLETRPSACTP